MRIVIAAALVVAALSVVQAQDKPQARVSLQSRGGAAAVTLDALAQSLGYKLHFDSEIDPESDLDFHVWLRVKESTPERAARILSYACGMNISVDHRVRRVNVAYNTESGATATVVKGYDVSVACSRFVAYQNQWGGPKPKADEKQPELRQRPAAERLSDLLGAMLDDPLRAGPTAVVAGDRLVVRDTPEMHTRVRQMLDLLVNEQGGTSTEAQAEAAIISALRKGKPPLELEETPRAGVLAQFCEAAGVDYFLNADVASWMEEDHLTLSLSGELSVLDGLELAFGEDTGRWRMLDNAVTVGVQAYAPEGYRVFEVGELLKRMDAAFQRQRTKPDVEEAFTGDLRSEGGVYVVVNALEAILVRDSYDVRVDCWGSRVIVRGGSIDLDLAEATLKEMGWEAPKGN